MTSSDGIEAYTRGSTVVVAVHGALGPEDLDQLSQLLQRTATSPPVDRAILDLTQLTDPDSLSAVLDVAVKADANEPGKLRVVCNRLMGSTLLAQARSGPVPVFDSIRAASTDW